MQAFPETVEGSWSHQDLTLAIKLMIYDNCFTGPSTMSRYWEVGTALSPSDTATLKSSRTMILIWYP